MNDIDINQAINRLQAMVAEAQGKSTSQQNDGSQNDFDALLKSAISNVNDMQKQAGTMSDAFVNGDPQANITEVMVALQKAKISFQAMLEVRNKLVVAYQDIMNMQI